jgi:type I site-specific restriction-modification system R (restriction) subunit
MPAGAIEQAVQVISSPQGATLDRRNRAVQRLLQEGHTLRCEEGGQEKFKYIYILDCDGPECNDFLVVNQLTIQGTAAHVSAGMPGNTRRPDLIRAIAELIRGQLLEEINR